MQDDKLIQSLYKKAKGYFVTETTVEYDSEGNEQKKKVTTKHMPPDISALKAYSELVPKKNTSTMTDEELEKEKIRLLALLAEYSKEESLKPQEREDKSAGKKN